MKVQVKTQKIIESIPDILKDYMTGLDVENIAEKYETSEDTINYILSLTADSVIHVSIGCE